MHGEWVEIVVQDSGIGLRPQDLEAIFQPFHQVDSSETRAYSGAGAGLALVRQLVGLHGGRVRAESAGPGLGSRFVVTLPRLEPARPLRVLVVEDEVSVLEALTIALRHAGYEVDGTPEGTDALRRLTEAPPGLMILDLGLPDVDGREILRQVRGAAQTRDLPVLVLTGLERVEAQEILALGANEFLTKPVSSRVLVETVGRLLVRASPGGGPAEG